VNGDISKWRPVMSAFHRDQDTTSLAVNEMPVRYQERISVTPMLKPISQARHNRGVYLVIRPRLHHLPIPSVSHFVHKMNSCSIGIEVVPGWDSRCTSFN
jgi:hypothetical protein